MVNTDSMDDDEIVILRHKTPKKRVKQELKEPISSKGAKVITLDEETSIQMLESNSCIQIESTSPDRADVATPSAPSESSVPPCTTPTEQQQPATSSSLIAEEPPIADTDMDDDVMEIAPPAATDDTLPADWLDPPSPATPSEPPQDASLDPQIPDTTLEAAAVASDAEAIMVQQQPADSVDPLTPSIVESATPEVTLPQLPADLVDATPSVTPLEQPPSDSEIGEEMMEIVPAATDDATALAADAVDPSTPATTSQQPQDSSTDPQTRETLKPAAGPTLEITLDQSSDAQSRATSMPQPPADLVDPDGSKTSVQPQADLNDAPTTVLQPAEDPMDTTTLASILQQQPAEMVELEAATSTLLKERAGTPVPTFSEGPADPQTPTIDLQKLLVDLEEARSMRRPPAEPVDLETPAATLDQPQEPSLDVQIPETTLEAQVVASDADPPASPLDTPTPMEQPSPDVVDLRTPETSLEPQLESTAASAPLPPQEADPQTLSIAPPQLPPAEPVESQNAMSVDATEPVDPETPATAAQPVSPVDTASPATPPVQSSSAASSGTPAPLTIAKDTFFASFAQYLRENPQLGLALQEAEPAAAAAAASDKQCKMEIDASDERAGPSSSAAQPADSNAREARGMGSSDPYIPANPHLAALMAALNDDQKTLFTEYMRSLNLGKTNNKPLPAVGSPRAAPVAKSRGRRSAAAGEGGSVNKTTPAARSDACPKCGEAVPIAARASASDIRVKMLRHIAKAHPKEFAEMQKEKQEIQRKGKRRPTTPIDAYRILVGGSPAPSSSSRPPKETSQSAATNSESTQSIQIFHPVLELAQPARPSRRSLTKKAKTDAPDDVVIYHPVLALHHTERIPLKKMRNYIVVI